MNEVHPTEDLLKKLDIHHHNYGASTGKNWFDTKGNEISRNSPVDGTHLGAVKQTDKVIYDYIVEMAEKAFLTWRNVPAPKRGNIIRQMGVRFRESKSLLSQLICREMGKPIREARGEVQEVIDICDFAAGLSRNLHGLTMPSERPSHRLMEQYHPYGIVGIISAFNFPVAVWAWNAMVAWVCGDVCIWKPSEKAPLSAIACQKIAGKVLKENDMPEGISNLIVGGIQVGEMMTKDGEVHMISATGSAKTGKVVGQTVAARLGRTLLELGGNNAMVVMPTADMKITIPAAVFGAVGTCGQRCTTTRRLIVHEKIFDLVKEKLVSAYQQLRVGNPLDDQNHTGPMVDKQAVQSYSEAVNEIVNAGGKEIVPAGELRGEFYDHSGCYVRPAVFEMENHFPVVQKETFAPILYMIKCKDIDEAIMLHNDVRQGLSSSIMTNDLREAEKFLAHAGSDCGIVNVNTGTTGAEIGGAFGGEKETGGGRECGSDAWKNYMRRQTSTINYGKEMPLAQGINFDI